MMASFSEYRQFNWHNFRICVLASMGACSFGYAGSIISTTLGQPAFLLYMNLVDPRTGLETSHANALTGTISGIFYAGSVIGLLSNSFVMDRYGRKAGIIFASFFAVLGAAGLAGAQNPAMFICFRLISGVGANAFLAVSAIFTSELATPHLRGFFVGWVGGGIMISYSFASVMGVAFHFVKSPAAQWRAPLALGLIFPVFMLSILPILPESPRWLLLQGRDEEARKIVMDLHTNPADGADGTAFARAEFSQMQQQIELDKQLDNSWFTFFSKRSYRKRLLITGTFGIIGQSTGVLVISIYQTTIYKSLGYDTVAQLCLTMGSLISAVPANFLGAWFMDRWGRKPILVGGAFGCAICLIIEATLTATYLTPARLENPNKSALAAAVALLYVFTFSYGASIDVVGTVYTAELFPNHMRSKGFAISLIILVLTTLIYVEVAPTALASIGWRFYLVFIVISTVGAFWICWMFPETKELSLEEIAAIFGDDEIAITTPVTNVTEKDNAGTVEQHEDEKRPGQTTSLVQYEV